MLFLYAAAGLPVGCSCKDDISAREDLQTGLLKGGSEMSSIPWDLGLLVVAEEINSPAFLSLLTKSKFCNEILGERADINHMDGYDVGTNSGQKPQHILVIANRSVSLGVVIHTDKGPFIKVDAASDKAAIAVFERTYLRGTSGHTRGKMDSEQQ